MTIRRTKVRCCSLRSGDVNAYIKDVTGEDFSAKDFRTWAGSVHALAILRKLPEAASETARRKAVTDAIREVAGQLRNTVAVCRKCYVHPDVIDAYLAGVLQAGGRAPAMARLRADEARLLQLLAASQAQPANGKKGNGG